MMNRDDKYRVFLQSYQLQKKLIGEVKEEARLAEEALKAHWKKHLTHTNWYEELEDELIQWIFPIVHDDPAIRALREVFYQVVEEMLWVHQIPLAMNGPDFDAERKARKEPMIDTIVIHHTEETNNSLRRLNAMGLVRQYADAHLEPTILGHPLRGKAIWSGHFDERGEMVFFTYHWLVEPDGTRIRLLKDTDIGWHAGNWSINVRSTGIAISGNYEQGTPPLTQIAGAAALIKERYPHMPLERIVGHREVKANRTCPGANFLGEDGWKNLLLQLI